MSKTRRGCDGAKCGSNLADAEPRRLRDIARGYGIHLVLLALIVVTAILSPAFLTGNNISNMLLQAAPLGNRGDRAGAGYSGAGAGPVGRLGHGDGGGCRDQFQRPGQRCVRRCSWWPWRIGVADRPGQRPFDHQTQRLAVPCDAGDHDAAAGPALCLYAGRAVGQRAADLPRAGIADLLWRSLQSDDPGRAGGGILGHCCTNRPMGGASI